MLIFSTALGVAWAWVLPWAGPFLAVARNLLAGARSRIPGGMGSAALGVAVLAILGLVAWHTFDAWWNPPARTYTAAEVEAASLKVEKASLERAVAEMQAEIRRRDEDYARLATTTETTVAELEKARAKIDEPDAVVVRADDGWLREWHRRGH